MSRMQWNPPNRFDPTTVEWEGPPPPARLELIEDASRSILSENDSPDVGFRWSVNPYRGCTHACAYCYARPFHEYLGFGAGTDFERKILVKREAPRLLAEAFERRSWTGETVAFSGVTDCYQSIEQRLRLTRGCLEVCVRYRNPVSIITRSGLILRDLDLLQELARHDAVRVTLSLPILDPAICRALEPGAPPPAVRLNAIRVLAEAGIPVGVSVSPLIPGIGDRLIPETLRQVREAGATWAFTILLRLPGAVASVFEHRLREALPHRAGAVMARMAQARGGRLNDPRFGHRKTGTGESWQVSRRLWDLWIVRLGFEAPPPPPDPSPFRRPGQAHQLPLLGG